MVGNYRGYCETSTKNCDQVEFFCDDPRIWVTNGGGIWDGEQLLIVQAIAVAGGLAGDEDSHRLGVAVDCLMGLAGCDLDALAGLEGEVVVLDLEGELAGEDEEELAGVDVVVAGLAGAGWHQLFDDVQFGRADEVPAVAVVAPGVVLSVGGEDGFGRHEVQGIGVWEPGTTARVRYGWEEAAVEKRVSPLRCLAKARAASGEITVARQKQEQAG
jgi:hypothetical protein